MSQPHKRAEIGKQPFFRPKSERTSNRVYWAQNGAFCRVEPAHDGSPVQRLGGGLRGIVSGKSKGSRFRQLTHLKTIDQQAAPIDRWRNLTFTIRRADVTPKAAAAYLKRLSDWTRRKFPGVSWHWAAEAQQRGTPHFHVLLHAPAGHDLDAGGLLHTAIMGQWCKLVAPGDEVVRWFHLDKNEDKQRRHRVGDVDAWERIASWDQLQKYLSVYIAGDNPAWEGVRTWGIHNRAKFPKTIRAADLTDDQFQLVKRQLRRLYEKSPNGRASVTLKVFRDNRPGSPMVPLWKYYVRGAEARSYECKRSLEATGEKSGHWSWCDPAYVRRLVNEKSADHVRRYRRKLRSPIDAAASFFLGSVETVQRMMAWAQVERPAREDDRLRAHTRAAAALDNAFDAIALETKRRQSRRDRWRRLNAAARRRRREELLDRLVRLGDPEGVPS